MPVSGVSGYRGYKLDSHGQSDQSIGANLFTARGVQTLQILQPRVSPSFASFAKEEPEGEAALQQARSRAQVIWVSSSRDTSMGTWIRGYQLLSIPILPFLLEGEPLS